MGQAHGIIAGNQKKVIVPVVEHGHFPMVDPMGIDDDHTLSGLPEYLGQCDTGQGAAVNDILKHVPGPHRGKLVAVSHHDHTGAPGHRLQQAVHQENVNHGHLIHNQHITLQRILGVARKL